MPPASRTSVATIPSVITARTTPYSAIVWPSSFRQLARTYSSHAANVISVHLLSSDRQLRRSTQPAYTGWRDETHLRCLRTSATRRRFRPRLDSSRTLAWPHAARCAFDVAIIERSRLSAIPRTNDSFVELPKQVTAELCELDDRVFTKRRVCGPGASVTNDPEVLCDGSDPPRRARKRRLRTLYARPQSVLAHARTAGSRWSRAGRGPPAPARRLHPHVLHAVCHRRCLSRP